jgi:hypothetical protein
MPTPAANMASNNIISLGYASTKVPSENPYIDDSFDQPAEPFECDISANELQFVFKSILDTKNLLSPTRPPNSSIFALLALVELLGGIKVG